MLKIRNRGNLRQNFGGAGMKDLKLPVIKAIKTQKRILSMDEYLKFVEFNLTNAFDKKAYAKWKKILVVNVPFSIT